VVQAVVVREGAVLLTERRTLRGWELPGGNCEPGEAPEDALRREVLEETGFEVRVGERVGRYRRSGFLAHEAWIYRCEIERGALRPSRETPRVAFFPTEKLPTSLFPWFRSPLEDALRGARDLEIEEHLGWAAVWAGMKIDLRTRLHGEERQDAVQSR
jgi:8-oxo-dGTP pyrophosphatase MutT (NUDIX family)